MKVIIVGGVAGGASAAARLRRLNEDAEIVMIERTGFVSYATCGLPYYAGGKIADGSDLTLQTPESFRTRFNIDVRTREEVEAIDPAARVIRVKRLKDGSEYTETYDKLILSTGAKPIRPKIPGIDSNRIYTVRTVEDIFRLKEVISKSTVKSAIVAGGGYIGLEMAENLVGIGIETRVIQRNEQVLKPFDYDMACIIQRHMRRHGVKLELNAAVSGFETTDRIKTMLEDGRSFSSDIVIMALGVSPETSLAKGAGIELGLKGAIIVDDRMRTSADGIFAVGDAVQVKNFVTGLDDVISLAGPASKQGRIAADNICGIDSRFMGSQGSSVIKMFDMTLANTGINENQAKDAGIAYDKVCTFSASHATYYPGARYMTLKVIFSKDDGRILGAQIAGFEGVDKRIDIIAAAIRAGMTSDGLEELDLAYAPPYSSAKDPVNMAGYVIGNVRMGLVKQFFWNEVDGLSRDGSVTLLDVREPEEFDDYSIDGFTNIPLDSLRDRIGEIDPSKETYVCCHSGMRSYIACRILSQNGISCSNLSGGTRFYEAVKEGM